jgi:DNA adenine methylase
MPSPFLPWVGSKRKLAEPIVAKLLQHHQPSSTYIEPFLGSGAVALAMPDKFPMVIGDACKPLGYLWWWIKQEPEAIAEYARGFGVERGEGWNTDEGYVAARYEHNGEPFSTEDWRPSARFLWLMHACFNGVYRENGNGYMNVPRGDRKRLNLPTPGELRAVASHLENTEVIVGDFEPMFDAAVAGDLI